MSPYTELEIAKLIGQLPSKTSSGHDNISNILLKEIGPHILSPLSQIFSDSMSLGIFSYIMKLADVIPLYKSKEKYLEMNYQSISLLTTMSKLLEKLVYCQVYRFLNKNSQLYESQYGFCNSYSCDNPVGEVVSCIVKNLELNHISIALFLDLSKVFDMLEHSLLLHKMERYSPRGTVLDWFKSYLSNRKIRVKCKPTSSGQIETSDEYPMEYGTPQGSCLDPLIFLILCNDLRLYLIFLHCVQFADDTTLITGHLQSLFVPFARMGYGNPVRVLHLFHNKYTGCN